MLTAGITIRTETEIILPHADTKLIDMNEIFKMFDSIPTEKIKQVNRISTVVSGIGDAKMIFKAFPIKYTRQLKMVAEWAGVVAMATELILKYRGE